MDRDFFSQPVSRSKGSERACYSSQPTFGTTDNRECSSVNNPSDDTRRLESSGRASESSVDRDGRSTSATVAVSASQPTDKTADSNVSTLFDSYKSINDRLTSLLMDFRSEKITLQNDLSRLSQENDFMKLEIERQMSNIERLGQNSQHLDTKLSKEEFETKKQIELKLLETQEIFGSVNSSNEFISGFKERFSQSVTEAHEFCRNMKEDMRKLKVKSLKASAEYMKSIDEHSNSYNEELSKGRRDVVEAESKLETGLLNVKQKMSKQAQLKQQLDSLLQEMEGEQKRKKELENHLLYHNSEIMKLKEERRAGQNKFETEANRLSECLTEAAFKNSALDSKISRLEEELIIQNEKCRQMASDPSAFREVLAEKQHKSEQIQEEIESLEGRYKALRKKHKEALSSMERKKETEVVAKELESVVSGLVEKCKGLEEARDRAEEAGDRSRGSLSTMEKDVERATELRLDLLHRVETARNLLEEKQTTLSNVKREGDALREALNDKLLRLERAEEGIRETDLLRNRNEQLCDDIKTMEQEMEERKKMMSYLQQLKLKQKEILENYCDKYEKGPGRTEEDGEEKSELSREYAETMRAMDVLGVIDLDSRIRSVAADIEFNRQQTEEAVEANKLQSAQLEAQYQSSLKELGADEEEHRSYCEDTLAKLDSEKRYIQGKISTVMNDVNTKRGELQSRVSELAQSVNNALCLFEKIIGYYSEACSQRLESGASSIHWDNTKEVLQEILLIPLHRLSKVRGMSFIDTFSASPAVYMTVISRTRTMFNSVLRESPSKPIEYTCRKLMEMCNALYYQSDNPEPLFSNKLNDTNYSTSSETEFNKR